MLYVEIYIPLVCVCVCCWGPGVVPPVDGVVPGGEPIDGVVPVLLQESQNKKINIWEYKVGLVVGNET